MGYRASNGSRCEATVSPTDVPCLTTTRRAVLAGSATLAALAVGVREPGYAASAPRSFALMPRAVVIDGKPVWLTIGSIDYFRVPAEECRATLLRAKRGGLNTVMTYVAWCFHERQPGVFTMDGDADLGRFLDIAAELGMYAYVRVGPFICDEFEGGGYPSWLITQPEIELRTSHAPTLKLLARWFDRLVPVIARRQVTRGGPVVLVQQENEYFYVGRPHIQDYQTTLVRMLRERGIEVPITDCNGVAPETRVPGSMPTLNSGGAAPIKALKAFQPDKPAIVSELYTDYAQMFGWPRNSYPTAPALLHEVMDTFAEGGMWSYFMWAGGTNFGFWASTSWKSDQSFITPRYYERAPVFEGGALQASYWVGKGCNLIARNLETWLTQSADAPMPFALGGPVRGRAARGPRGHLIFVTPAQTVRTEQVFHTDDSGGPLIQLGEDYPEGEIAAAAGVMRLGAREIELASPSSLPCVLPFALEIDPGRVIDHANATLLGLAGTPARRVIVLRGTAGRAGLVSVNGEERGFVFPADRPLAVAVGGATVLALDEALADRAWFADGRVLIGPAYVGQARAGGHECFVDGRTGAITSVGTDGAIATRTVEPAADVSAHIALTGWTAHALPEIAADEGWTPLGEPRSVEHLGQDQGYSWYRARLYSDTARETAIFPTVAKDRLTVFVNGARAGVWGRGDGAERGPLAVRLRAGDNRIAFLADNMGRRSEGTELDAKGIYGPVYADAAVLPLPAPELTPVATPPTNSWRYQTYRHFYPQAPLRRVSFTVPTRAGDGLTLSLRWVPQFVWILVDGVLVAEHPGDLALTDGSAFSATVLDQHVTGRPLRIDLVYVGEPTGDFAAKVKLVAYPLAARLGGWGFRRWAEPTAAVAPRAGDPAWWTCAFPMPQAPAPFFLVTQGLSKGHVWLNGRALGRYWSIGPQRSLYVPHSWLRAENRLAILDEGGRSPEGVYLERDVRVPTQSVIV